MKTIVFILSFIPYFGWSQTTLQVGDIAVVGFVNNYQSCDSLGNYNDIFYFICRQDIVLGTVIDFTDNSWEREYPNFWGTSEGVYRFTYQGGNTITAGTVFPIQFTRYSSQVQANNPDWLFTNLSGGITVINFHTAGDQLFVMQNGEWNYGNTGHQGTYSGNLIYAFNTMNNWGLSSSTGICNLPSSLICYNTIPGLGSAEYVFYSGPMEAVPMQEWHQRFNTIENWTEVSSCSDFDAQFSLSEIIILDEEIQIIPINQTICSNQELTLQVQTNYQNISFQWYYNVSNTYENATIISNEITDSFTPNFTQIGNYYFFCEITINNCSRFTEISQINYSENPITNNITLN